MEPNEWDLLSRQERENLLARLGFRRATAERNSKVNFVFLEDEVKAALADAKLTVAELPNGHQKGMRVEVTFRHGTKETFRNVTEIHYGYKSPIKITMPQIAFESNIHGTGTTYYLDTITEFVVTPETEIAKEI
jgi:hypothetical protein